MNKVNYKSKIFWIFVYITQQELDVSRLSPKKKSNISTVIPLL